MTARVRMSESGAQLLGRLEGRKSLIDIDQHLFPESGGPSPGDVVEFHGAEGSGKTETLYRLISRCLLPELYGGLEVEVAYVDTDYHFDTLRLVAVLEALLLSVSTATEETVRSCLRRLSVVHCSSSAQLLLTLHHLEGSMDLRPAFRLLVIDSISAFYWVDRSTGREIDLRKCVDLLECLRRDFGVAVIATCHAVMKNRGRGVPDFDKPYLCRAWQKILTHRLLFTKTEPNPSAGDGKQVFTVSCSTVRTKGVKRSSFYITDEGVKFIEGETEKSRKSSATTSHT